ncbi:MAG: D-2-hydroxyacid dehydrogenase family protein [Thiolinea sp.]
MKIAILDDYQQAVRTLDCFKLLDGHEVTVFNDTVTDIDTLVSRLSDQDALVLIRERTTLSGELLARLPKLKLISQTGKISNHINLKDCTRHNIAFAEGKGSPIAPSELCWTLIMAASRQLIPYATRLSEGQWQQSGSNGLGRTLHGLTLGIWGYGKIGQRIAQYGKAFGMNVLVWGSEPSRLQAQEDGFHSATTKTAFFQSTDIVSMHLRLNAATRHCVKLTDLQQMKTNALFVNISRAELVEEKALLTALTTGSPGFAALDVYEQEPANLENQPLLNMENVLCSPHIGYVEQNSYELYFRIAFENVNAFFRGEPDNIANPEVL